MLKKLLLNLQLFGEGGDGGDGGSAAQTGEGEGFSGDEAFARIPERARKTYQKAVEKHQPKDGSTPGTADGYKTEEHLSYADLIKSEQYKDEHKAYMDKTIGDRLKKYKGIEDTVSKQKEILDIVAAKYGITPDSETFLEELKSRAEADDSYYEQYAMDHDLSTDEARRIVSMERKVAEIERQKEEMKKQEEMRERIAVLQHNAEKTKAQFPDFDLETCLQDERFRRICFTTNGDTTAAYMACNYGSIIPNTVQMVTNNVRKQTAQSIASGKSRPIENGIASQASSVVTTDFSKMNKAQLRAYAEEQRRKQRGF